MKAAAAPRLAGRSHRRRMGAAAEAEEDGRAILERPPLERPLSLERPPLCNGRDRFHVTERQGKALIGCRKCMDGQSAAVRSQGFGGGFQDPAGTLGAAA